MTLLNAFPVVVNTWYLLQVKVNKLANRVDFFVNGTYIGYCAANIPIGVARALTTMLQIVKSGAGVAPRTMQADYYYHKIGFKTARY